MSDMVVGGKKLKTLEGQNIPNKIDGYFNCSDNKLTNLEFGPKVVSEWVSAYDNKLTSLEFCPTKIGDEFYCQSNNLTNLKDIHKHFKKGYIKKSLHLAHNPLKSHLIGVILIPKLRGVVFSYSIETDIYKVFQILNKHLLYGRDVLECQEELIQNGFKDFAKL